VVQLEISQHKIFSTAAGVKAPRKEATWYLAYINVQEGNETGDVRKNEMKKK